ncbi:MAG: cyanophycinase [Flavobacteriales bacterium]|nr:cyanophycinase [Flavobacteriales bacterium]
MTGKEGVLIPIGGSEDRGDEENPRLPFKEKGVLKHVLSQANGVDSRVVVVTSASSIPDEVFAQYKFGFELLGCRDVKHWHITDKSQCEDEEVLADFSAAHVIFFSGGNQSKLPKRMGRTSLSKLLRRRYAKDSLVIAGTSAGAMAMSQEMIAGGSASEAFVKGAVRMRKGFGLIPELIIDTHFVRRGRFGRLAEAVARHPQCLGIGLAEDSGVVIREGREFRVIGSGMVIVMDPRTIQHNNHAILEEGDLMSMTGLTTHFLANGDRFFIDEHTVEVLPLNAEYI